jgi:hypothetical protein
MSIYIAARIRVK